MLKPLEVAMTVVQSVGAAAAGGTVVATGAATLAQVDTWAELVERWGLPTFLLLGAAYLIATACKHLFVAADKYAEKLVAATVDWIAKDAEARQRAATAAESAAERDGQTIEALREIRMRLEDLHRER